MRRWRLLAAALTLLAVDAIAGAAHASPSFERCLEQAHQRFVGAAVRRTFRPSPLARYDNVMADARGIVWRPKPRRGSGIARYAVAFGGTGNCWLGGEIIGTGKPSADAPSALAVGTGHGTGDTEIHSLKIARTRNGIWVGQDALDLRLTNVLFADTNDSCIIADHRGDLIVDHAFLHRCARVVKLQNRLAGRTVTIRNSLIRIDNRPRTRAMGRLFNGGALRSNAQVHFNDNTVVTARRLDRHSLSVLEASCKDNTLIWLGQGDYPAELPGCFTVVEGKRAWRAARRAWLKRHERQLAKLGRDPAADGSACALPEVPAALAPHKTVGHGSPASCNEGALRNALAGGGTITFACGPAPVTIPLASELVVSSRTVLDGGGSVTLDGQDRTRIIRNNSQLTLQRIALARGRQEVVWNGSPNGGGAVNTTYGNRLYVVDSTFRHNRTSSQGFGGAIFQAGKGALTVVRSRFEGNLGGGGGAIYSLLAGLQVADSAFVRNQATSGWHGGGGIMTDGASARSGNGGSGGEIAICGTRFNANQAVATGGGAYLYAYPSDQVSVTRSTFTGNSVTPNSGGVSMGGGVRFGASPALVAESTFRNNSARMGGAIATSGKARTQVRDSTFECNSSDIGGGNVLARGNLTRRC